MPRRSLNILRKTHVQIHSQMLESMLRAKMSFFTQTRAGSIVQRFSKDLNDTIDCSELFGEMAEVFLQSQSLCHVRMMGRTDL